MWDMNRWSVSPPRPPLLARETVGMEMLGMVNTLETVARGDWVLVADSMTSCQQQINNTQHKMSVDHLFMSALIYIYHTSITEILARI